MLSCWYDDSKDWADAVITLDADLQDDYQKCIPQMIDAFEEGNEIVYGVKVSRKADPILKRMSAQAFYHLQEKMGVNSIFNHADFRLMSRQSLEILSGYKERNLYLRGLIPSIGLNLRLLTTVSANVKLVLLNILCARCLAWHWMVSRHSP